MKKLIIFAFIIISNVLFSQILNDTISYYNEITKSTEFTNITNKPQRWKSDVKIYIDGIHDSVAETEIYNVINELNELINTINISVVNSKTEANLIAFFGFCSDYDKFEPKAAPYSGSNYGLFVVNTKNNEIINGSFYVDVVRCGWLDTTLTDKTKKHLVREELTQSLGLYNDSMKYPDSIFYQGFTFTNEYSDLDKKIIRIHYND